MPGRGGAAIALVVEVNGVIAPAASFRKTRSLPFVREPVWEPAAGYGRRPAATRRDKHVAQARAWPALMQVTWPPYCHGKEKVYGSIP